MENLMGITFAVVALAALIGMAAVLAALVNRRHSIPLTVAALFVAVTAGGGAWYAWAESHSTPWTLGYGAVAVISLLAFIRQGFIGREQRRERTDSRGAMS
jgi:predicted tellurium resistance membrane protein TerC